MVWPEGGMSRRVNDSRDKARLELRLPFGGRNVEVREETNADNDRGKAEWNHPFEHPPRHFIRDDS